MAVNQLRGLLANKEVTDIFFWQTLGAILQAALAPEIAALQQESFNLTPTLVLSAADYADAVIKGHMSLAEAQSQARLAGVDKAPLQLLIDSGGAPPGLDFLTEAWRRGIIGESGAGGQAVSLEAGIRESRLKDKWIPTVKAMQYNLPPVGVIVEGWLRAQITEAQARDLLRQSGVDDATATLMYKAAGRPPSPQELAAMTHRGIIPEAGEGGDTISLRQGYLETDLKNKWYAAWRELQAYIPPPRATTAMLRHGSITTAQATKFYSWAGASAEVTAALLADAQHQKTAATRELSKAELVQLYADRLLSAAELTTHLEGFGYTAADAALEIELADFRHHKAIVSRAVSRIHSLYVGHKLDEQGALASLDALGVDAAGRDELIKIWRVELADNVAILTAAEIAHLVKLNLIDEPTGLTELEARGYSPLDAWLRLAVALGGRPSSPRPA